MYWALLDCTGLGCTGLHRDLIGWGGHWSRGLGGPGDPGGSGGPGGPGVQGDQPR